VRSGVEPGGLEPAGPGSPARAPITHAIRVATLGEAWLAAAGLVLREGRPARWGTEATQEVPS